MTTDRPDLSNVAPAVVAYIEALEGELTRLRAQPPAPSLQEEEGEPSEPPTSINLITVSAQGLAKRTARHHYDRQHRGGMGVFDLETPEEDAPALLVQADASAHLILVSDHARIFRLPVGQIAETPARARGHQLSEVLNLRADERIVVALPDSGGSHVALVTSRGQLRRVAERYFGPSLQSGAILYNVAEGGAPAAACWTRGDDDLFIATRSGQAIRFAERLAPIRGCLGMRVAPSDTVIGIAAVGAADGVFLLSTEGKGSIRLMAGFAANKSPGAGGKLAMRADALAGICGVRMANAAATDIFAISRLGKLIRFAASDIPPKEGVVQGVNCMNLRSDECTAVTCAELV